MTLGAVLLVAGFAVAWWQPRVVDAGHAPRSALAVLLVAAAAVWVGSFGITAAVVSGEYGGVLTACGALWRQLAGGELTWWQTAIAAAWLLLFPGRALVAAATGVGRTHRLCGHLTAATAAGRSAQVPACVHLVPGLGTPALTVGVLKPQVFIDIAFWDASPAHTREIVLRHELAHRRARHGLLELAARTLTRPLEPVPAGRRAYEGARRHLEALADDAVARRLGNVEVGQTLGHVALHRPPPVGLGATGASLWRVRRLLADNPQRTNAALALTLPPFTALSGGLLVVAADAVATLGPILAAQLCRL